VSPGPAPEGASERERLPAAPIDPARLAFDIDGVIADTMTLFLEIAREEFGIRGIRYDDITRYNLEECLDLSPETIARIVARILEGDHRDRLQPIPGSPQVLARLARRVDPVLCVTARPDGARVSEWLRGVLPAGGGAVEVVATGSFEAKSGVLRERRMAWFVEDRLETCHALSAAGITPILFRQPWNREPHPFLEVSCWEELSDLIRW
jgi:hypothetical protein